jgi:hypothetical protein
MNGLDPSGLRTAGGGHFGYGHFCGFNRAATCIGNVPAPPPANPLPIDGLDAACMSHDCCLATGWDVAKQFCGLKNCNKPFCKAVKAFDCDTAYPRDPLQAYQCHLMQKNAQVAFCY